MSQTPPNQTWGQQPDNYGQEPYPAQAAAPTPVKKSKTPAIIAGVVALALIAGAVIFGMQFFRGATPAAIKALPNNAVAVLELNLAPSTSQQLALKNWVEKFPSLEADTSTTDYKEALWNLIPEADDKPDYATEVKPWLGDSLAVAVVLDDKKEFQPVIAIETTDVDKAGEFATREFKGMTNDFIGKTMVLWDEELVSLNVADVEKAPLADSENFKADRAKLGGDDYLATFWGIGEALTEVSGADFSGAIAQQVSLVRDARFAGGLQVSDEFIDLKMAGYSPQEVSGSVDLDDFVTSLPGNGLGAFAFAIPDAAWDQFGPDAQKMIDETPELQQLGITSLDDLKAVIGNKIAVTVGVENGQPSFGLKSETAHPDKQAQILEPLFAQAGTQVQRVTDGNVTAIGLGQTPEKVLNPESKLADNETFKKVTDLSGDLQSVVFVDVANLSSIPDFDQMIAGDPTAKEMVDAFAGAGIVSAAQDGHYSDGHIRFVGK